MSFAWFRLYKELKDDPKIGALDDACFRVFIEAMCWSCEVGNDDGDTGLTLETANWAFRRDVTTILPKLFQAGVLSRSDNGKIFVTNWAERQFLSDHSTIRVRKSRLKQRETLHETLQLPLLKQGCNGEKAVKDSDSDSDTDTEKRRGGVGGVSDSDWIKELQQDKAYKHLSVEVEYAKMVNWCKQHRKQPTRRRFINWLNRIDQPMTYESKRSSEQNPRNQNSNAGRAGIFANVGKVA